jgi:hypothetical protein
MPQAPATNKKIPPKTLTCQLAGLFDSLVRPSRMQTFEKILFLGSLVFATVAAYTVAIGFYEGVLCYQSHCARRGAPDQRFLAYIFLYSGFVALGLASAWRSYKNIKSGAHLKR